MHTAQQVVAHIDALACKNGVATISRLLKITGLFCRISSLLEVSFTKETYNFKEPINRRHPIDDITIHIRHIDLLWWVQDGEES